jgi:opacity protein-like surface antigen
MFRTISLACALILASVIPAQASGTYVTGFGGANWDDVASPLDSDTGFVVGGALGTSVKAVPGLRAELEVAFRTNDVDVFGGFIEAEHNTTSVMGNVAYDFNAGIGPFRPYVLAGVGFAHTEGVIENLSLATLESSGFAWQLGAGLNTQLAEGVTAGVGYRYFQGPELEVLGFEVSDGSNHSVLATVTLDLN